MILVVEDNVVNQTVARASLERLGCRVVVAGDGAEALKILDEEVIDLVFMDLFMPEVSGLEATRIIRADNRSGWEKLPIIAMTASAMATDREDCINAGMNDCITKPFTPRQLRECLDSWL